tara:strand:+ start:1236 stop:1394 length:159 start_codon:yes stop_codon:yes gene_type:complete
MLREIAVDEEGGKNDVEISRYINMWKYREIKKINYIKQPWFPLWRFSLKSLA